MEKIKKPFSTVMSVSQRTAKDYCFLSVYFNFERVGAIRLKFYFGSATAYCVIMDNV